MKLTALDIHQKEFGHSMRGYREDEVDDFLDQAAAEIDRLHKENETYLAHIHEIEPKLQGLESDRNAINSALVMAQHTADELVVDAEIQRDRIIAEATKAAEKITRDIEFTKRELLQEIKRLKNEEQNFRRNYHRMLEDSMRAIAEVHLSDAVEEALRDKSDSYAAAVARATDEVSGADPFEIPELVVEMPEAEPAVEAVVPSAPEIQPAVVAEVEVFAAEEEIFTTDADFAANSFGETVPEQGYQAPACAFAPEPEPKLELEPVTAFAPEPVEPKQESFTQGLIMGEVGDRGPSTITLEEPRDFQIPGGNRWGDREDDIDIEEID